jgi:hypothetical protein
VLGLLEIANCNHWPTYITITTAAYTPEMKVLSLGGSMKMYNKNGGNACIVDCKRF